jgi:hypothetical protein
MNEIEINPDISEFIVFSGGGGLINRQCNVQLAKGETKLRIRNVPASFDPETFLVELKGKNIELTEIIIKKPNRQYVEDNLRREAETARRLIQESVDIGERRKEIIDICEEVSMRTYLDEEVYVMVRVKTKAATKTDLLISYFIDDGRFSWKPTVTIETGQDGEVVRVQGFIAINNESARLFENIEVSFAEFTKDMKEDTAFAKVPPQELRRMMTQQAMNVSYFK